MSRNPGFALTVLLATLGALVAAVRPARCEHPPADGVCTPSRHAVCPVLDHRLDDLPYPPAWIDGLFEEEPAPAPSAVDYEELAADLAEVDAFLEACEVEACFPPIDIVEAQPVLAPRDAVKIVEQFLSHYDAIYDSVVYGRKPVNPFENVVSPAEPAQEVAGDAPSEAFGNAAALEASIGSVKVEAWDPYGYDEFSYDEERRVTTEQDFECWPEPPAPAAPIARVRAEDRRLEQLILLDLADRMEAAGRWLQSASRGLERIALGNGDSEGPTLR